MDDTARKPLQGTGSLILGFLASRTVRKKSHFKKYYATLVFCSSRTKTDEDRPIAGRRDRKHC
jgi:hypothetical protein